MVEQISDMIPNLKAELLDPVVAKGVPSEEVFKALDQLADDIENKHKELGILME
jgi:hypothetical protein